MMKPIDSYRLCLCCIKEEEEGCVLEREKVEVTPHMIFTSVTNVSIGDGAVCTTPSHTSRSDVTYEEL